MKIIYKYDAFCLCGSQTCHHVTWHVDVLKDPVITKIFTKAATKRRLFLDNMLYCLEVHFKGRVSDCIDEQARINFRFIEA